MEKSIGIAPTTDPAACQQFYRLLGEAPASAAAWEDRQATLRRWRVDPRFEAYWASIDHILADDFASYRRRAATLAEVGDLAGYDFDTWRKQREYDLNHAHDHLP